MKEVCDKECGLLNKDLPFTIRVREVNSCFAYHYIVGFMFKYSAKYGLCSSFINMEEASPIAAPTQDIRGKKTS